MHPSFYLKTFSLIDRLHYTIYISAIIVQETIKPHNTIKNIGFIW